MMIPIANAVTQTQIFIVCFGLALIASCKKRVERCTLSPIVTAELKGLAVLAVVFAHIGYYLVDDHRFLVPLSQSAGVGVNVFLVLSGYGLTYSMMRKSSSILEFYQRRVSRIFLPLWMVLIVILLADWLFLDLTYPLKTAAYAFIGFFPRANLYEDINAPLWYLTMTLFYYLIYPLLFFKRFPLLSSLLIGTVGYLVAKHTIPVDEGVLGAYRIHSLAFPLGMVLAAFFCTEVKPLKRVITLVTDKLNQPHAAAFIVRGLGVVLFSSIVIYTTMHANIGKGVWLEQRTSLLTTLALIAVFVLKPFEIRLLSVIGRYSYEIYLIHWPLLYRYDVLYQHVPAAIATLGYLIIFVGLSAIIQRLTKQIFQKTGLAKEDSQ